MNVHAACNSAPYAMYGCPHTRRARIYDLHKQVEVGTLVHHEGTVTALAFYKNTHLFSAGEDGRVCIWDARTWSLLKELPGHRCVVAARAGDHHT